MGIEAVFEQFPFRRCLKMVEEGHAHVLISVLKTPERGDTRYSPGSTSASPDLSLHQAGNQVLYGVP